MKLTLSDVGKIRTASVDINGITVIAGENNTGKSTVGRALFAVFNGFYSIETQIHLERVRSIERLLTNFCREAKGYSITISRSGISELAGHIVADKEMFLGDHEKLQEEVMSFLDAHGIKNQKLVIKSDDASVDELIPRMVESLSVSDTDMLSLILGKYLYSEFYGQVVNVYSQHPASVQLQIRGETIELSADKDGNVSVENPLSLRTEAVYIDDPFVLDDISVDTVPFYYRGRRVMDHRSHLKTKLLRERSEYLVDEVIVNNKLKRIYDKINSVYSGEFVQGKGGLSYRKPDSRNPIDARNLSTGLKTFAIIKQLLLNGSLEHNGTIVLDEPEIHLHPEWQVLFAELIVLIQKDFDMHILLNTHSPYFLRAIEVFSAKYDILDKCKFYLAEAEGEYARIIDVTDDVDKIYSKLAAPLQELEDVRWQDD